MQILRAADYRTMPWKNGMGSTTEIAIYPAGAKLDDFDWRVSMAQVTSDGPFSSFPGIDRTLLVLEGAGIDLDVEGEAPARIDRETIHAFAGDAPTTSTLIDGPIVDLNIMTRRGVVMPHVQRIKTMDRLDFPIACQTLLLIESGNAIIRTPTELTLGARDALLLDGMSQSTIALSATSATRIIVIQFR